jgi:hypothetical protein
MCCHRYKLITVQNRKEHSYKTPKLQLTSLVQIASVHNTRTVQNAATVAHYSHVTHHATRRVQKKETELFKQSANQHRERATATERT